uniref:DUF1279 domain-containing protein n=1 Tax=Ananas comosus var. bracteatus TaxID=296719 RepID=A0A6V7Q197_ANACO|nr:unnamed protein product [Ananas comosus var. bracteatus]
MAAAALLLSTLPPTKRDQLLQTQLKPSLPTVRPPRSRFKIRAVQETKEELKSSSSSPEEITEKYGLEFGLWKIFSSKERGGGGGDGEGKENAGIDVQALLNKVGIVTDETGGKVGTFALAYAAHKAASPIRFPPTVALTPIVASWIGKKRAKSEEK